MGSYKSILKVMIFLTDLSLQVSVSKSKTFKDTLLYTCDQTCSGEPRTMPSNGSPLVYPIRPTNPSTPILYIAKEQQQLVELR